MGSRHHGPTGQRAAGVRASAVLLACGLLGCGGDGPGTDTGAGVEPDLASADARILGQAGGDHAGRSVAVGDLDGDGIGDVLVGAGGRDAGGDGAGAVSVVLGPPPGGTSSLSTAEATLVGEAAGDHAGWAAALADVDGDGAGDVLVGAPWEASGGPGAGAVYLVLGPLGGTRDLQDAQGKLTGGAAEAAIGWSLAIGDVDGNRVEDVLVGAPGDGTGGVGSGAVRVVLGRAGGAPDLSSADAALVGEDPGDAAGWSLAVGDVDGDGIEDVLAGARLAEAGGTFAGAAYVVLGPVTGTTDLSAADAVFVGEAAGDQAGWSLAVGDVDGDGLEDALVGAPWEETGGAGAGAVYVVGGPVRGTVDLSAADAKLVGTAVYGGAGSSLAAGDLDGDGCGDVLAGAAPESAQLREAGAVYLVLGPIAGSRDLADADARYAGEAGGDAAGSSVAVGDVDGDGLEDVLAGAPTHDGADPDAGVVYVLLGGGS